MCCIVGSRQVHTVGDSWRGFQSADGKNKHHAPILVYLCIGYLGTYLRMVLSQLRISLYKYLAWLSHYAGNVMKHFYSCCSFDSQYTNMRGQ